MQLVAPTTAFAGRHQLDLTALVLEVGEVEAAVAALAEDAAGDVDDLAAVGAGAQVPNSARIAAAVVSRSKRTG